MTSRNGKALTYSYDHHCYDLDANMVGQVAGGSACVCSCQGVCFPRMVIDHPVSVQKR